MEGPRGFSPPQVQSVNLPVQGYIQNFPPPNLSPPAQPRLTMSGPVITVNQPSPPPPEFRRVEVLQGLACPWMPVGYLEEHQALTDRQGQTCEWMGRLNQRVKKLEADMVRQEKQYLAHLGGLLDRVNLDLHQSLWVRGLVQGQEGQIRRMEGSMGEKQEVSTQTSVEGPVALTWPSAPVTLEASTEAGPQGEEEGAATPYLMDPARLAGPASPQLPPSARHGKCTELAERCSGI